MDMATVPENSAVTNSEETGQSSKASSSNSDPPPRPPKDDVYAMVLIFSIYDNFFLQ